MPSNQARLGLTHVLLTLSLAGCAAPERARVPAAAPHGQDDPKALVLDLGGGARLELVEIPAGVLLVAPSGAARGSNVPEPPPGASEAPARAVRLAAPFYIGRCEVTQKQWAAVMGNNPSWYPGDDLPVHRVNWVDCHDFCARLAQRVGRPVRLPSEAEWEYACRASTRTAYSFGDDPASIGQYAWCATTSGRKPNPVAQKRPNPWGLYDMHGNVWEWCQDLYYDDADARAMPADGSAAEVGEPAGRRVLRGGSWFNPPEAVRSNSRLGRPAHLSSAYIGFRVVVPAQPAPGTPAASDE